MTIYLLTYLLTYLPKSECSILRQLCTVSEISSTFVRNLLRDALQVSASDSWITESTNDSGSPSESNQFLLEHVQTLLKVSSKSVHNIMSNRTDKPTDSETYLFLRVAYRASAKVLSRGVLL